MLSQHPTLYFLYKLSGLSLQRNQEKQTLVEELKEKTQLLDELEKSISTTLSCFPEELVEFLKNHGNIQSLAEFAADLNIEPLSDTQNELLIAASQRLEKFWRLEKQVREEKNKKYQMEQLLKNFETTERDFQSILCNFKAEQSSASQMKFDQEMKFLNKLKKTLDQIHSNSQSIDVTHEDIVQLVKEIASLEAQVQEEQLQLDTYQMLPQDPVLARIVLDEAKEKLTRLDNEKEAILRSMKFA